MSDKEKLKAEIAAMSREELETYAFVMNELLDARDRVINLIPECPEHGAQCIPHAEEWVKARLADKMGIIPSENCWIVLLEIEYPNPQLVYFTNEKNAALLKADLLAKTITPELMLSDDGLSYYVPRNGEIPVGSTPVIMVFYDNPIGVVKSITKGQYRKVLSSVEFVYKQGSKLQFNNELMSHLENRPAFNDVSLEVFRNAKFIELVDYKEGLGWQIVTESGSGTGSIPDEIIQNMFPYISE